MHILSYWLNIPKHLWFYSKNQITIQILKSKSTFQRCLKDFCLLKVAVSLSQMAQHSRSKDKLNQRTAKRMRCPRDKTRLVLFLCTQTQFLTRGKISHCLRCNCRNLSPPSSSVSFCIMNESLKGPSTLVLYRAQCQALNCWFNVSHFSFSYFALSCCHIYVSGVKSCKFMESHILANMEHSQNFN